jgi:hypothetical protein
MNGCEQTMSCEVEINEQSDYLKIVLSGTSELEDYLHIADTALQTCIRLHIGKLLVDYRNLDVQTNVFEDLTFVEHLSNSAIRKTIRRVAVVHGSSRDETAPFFETMCQNRGLNVKIFSDFNAAEDWLTSQVD